MVEAGNSPGTERQLDQFFKSDESRAFASRIGWWIFGAVMAFGAIVGIFFSSSEGLDTFSPIRYAEFLLITLMSAVMFAAPLGWISAVAAKRERVIVRPSQLVWSNGFSRAQEISWPSISALTAYRAHNGELFAISIAANKRNFRLVGFSDSERLLQMMRKKTVLLERPVRAFNWQSTRGLAVIASLSVGGLSLVIVSLLQFHIGN